MPLSRLPEGCRLAARLPGRPQVPRVPEVGPPKQGTVALKTLLILRHGKSSWADTGLDDHDRPLKKRGRRGARSIGSQLAAAGLVPDLTLSSTARRARGTARHALAACGADGRLILTRALYGSGVERHLAVIAEHAGDEDERVMVVGHNPDLEQLAGRLGGEPVTLKTAYLAVIELDVGGWGELTGASGRLGRLLTPEP